MFWPSNDYSGWKDFLDKFIMRLCPYNDIQCVMHVAKLFFFQFSRALECLVFPTYNVMRNLHFYNDQVLFKICGIEINLILD